MNREADSLHDPQDVENTPHTIRLHGPWQCELPNRETTRPGGIATSSESLTVKLPVDWESFLHEHSADSMIWRRSFGRPTNLSEREQVQLMIAPLRGDLRVWMNDVELQPLTDNEMLTAFDVTQQLEDRNQVVLTIDSRAHHTRAANESTEQAEFFGKIPFGQVYLQIVTLDE